MTHAWNDILKLPEGALAGGKRVPKTQLAEQAKLAKASAASIKLLDKLRDIRFFASLTKSNSHIQPVKNDAYDIESIIFLTCGLNSTTGITEALRMAHGCFPNPTVILAEGHANPGAAVSIALRRKSLSEHGAFVTERVYASGLFDAGKTEYAPYLERLSLATLPQTTLLDYLTAFGDRTLLARSVRVLGFYPICKDADAELLMRHVGTMNELTSKIGELQDARKSKDATLADTTKLRVEMRKLEQRRASVMGEIKEICQ